MLSAISNKISTIYLIFCFVLFTSLEVTAQSGPPYYVHWINQVGVSTNGQILTKTLPQWVWTNAGGISSNVLPANTDGWIEFTGGANTEFIVGLAVNNVIDLTAFSNAIFMDYANNAYSTYDGSVSTAQGNWQVGDVFRISREQSTVNYYRNGSVIHSVAVNPALVLTIKSSIRLPGKSTPSITTSFDGQLILRGTVTGVEGNNGNGSISLIVSGGTSPYTYSWSSGETSSSLSNKAPGLYTVTVADAAGRAQERSYSLGYKINWINQIGVNTNGLVLTKFSPGQWLWTNAGGICSNILPANTDGWMEFSGGAGDEYIVGLAANNIINSTAFSNALFVDYASNSYTTYEGSVATNHGSWQTGDIFRIWRQEDTVRYYRNGVEFHSVNVDPGLTLTVKSTIRLPAKSTPQIVTSFDKRLIVQGLVAGTPGNTGAGGISLSVAGGTSPYSYIWSSSEQTSTISNKPPGSYTVTVSDDVGRTQPRTYGLGYRVGWISHIGVNASGSILTKISPSQWLWTNAGGYSSNILIGNTDGWMEFSAGNGAHYIVGLASNNTINSNAFNNGIYIDYDNNSYSTFEGNVGTAHGSWQTGDIFRISREGNVVKYYRNGSMVRSVSVEPSLVLKVKATIQVPGKSIPNIVTSFWASDGVVRTYYSIANGNWTTPSIWSLTENGPPSTVYPDDIDKVVIKGHEVIVNSNIKSAGITITSTNDQTRLKVEGNMGVLTVKDNITMNRQGNVGSGEALLVQNNGKLDVVD